MLRKDFRFHYYLFKLISPFNFPCICLSFKITGVGKAVGNYTFPICLALNIAAKKETDTCFSQMKPPTRKIVSSKAQSAFCLAYTCPSDSH